MKKIGVLLSGCGVYDGSEIHEAVLSLLSIAEHGAEAVCFAPNEEQHHVVDHTSGDEMNETRNVLKEAARIARGNIKDIEDVTENDFDALVIPGGFGAAKNLTDWAFNGPDGKINEHVRRIIVETNRASKPIVALCMGPTVVAKALEESGKKVKLTVGTTDEASEYDIAGVTAGITATGAKGVMKSASEIEIDDSYNVISASCYMMDVDILGVRNNIKKAIDALFERL